MNYTYTDSALALLRVGDRIRLVGRSPYVYGRVARIREPDEGIGPRIVIEFDDGVVDGWPGHYAGGGRWRFDDVLLCQHAPAVPTADRMLAEAVRLAREETDTLYGPKIESEPQIYYFAYGMNMSPLVMGYAGSSASGIEPVGAGRLDGWRLRFSEYADVQRDASSSVYGGVWRLPVDGLQKLDVREDYPRLYERQEVEVEMEGGYSLTAWVYYKREPGELLLPFMDYMDTVRAGYDFFDMGEEARDEFESAELEAAMVEEETR